MQVLHSPNTGKHIYSFTCYISVGGPSHETLMDLSYSLTLSSLFCPFSIRMLLYQVSEDVTQENLNKMKFLLSNKLAKGRLDLCTVKTNTQNTEIYDFVIIYWVPLRPGGLFTVLLCFCHKQASFLWCSRRLWVCWLRWRGRIVCQSRHWKY